MINKRKKLVGLIVWQKAFSAVICARRRQGLVSLVTTEDRNTSGLWIALLLSQFIRRSSNTSSRLSMSRLQADRLFWGTIPKPPTPFDSIETADSLGTISGYGFKKRNVLRWSLKYEHETVIILLTFSARWLTYGYPDGGEYILNFWIFCNVQDSLAIIGKLTLYFLLG